MNTENANSTEATNPIIVYTKEKAWKHVVFMFLGFAAIAFLFIATMAVLGFMAGMTGNPAPQVDNSGLSDFVYDITGLRIG